MDKEEKQQFVDDLIYEMALRITGFVIVYTIVKLLKKRHAK